MGTQEAVACGVPMIGIPLFADQFTNIDTYVGRHIAIRVDVGGITEEKLDAALNTILWDPMYRFAESFLLYHCANFFSRALLRRNVIYNIAIEIPSKLKLINCYKLTIEPEEICIFW